MVDYEGYNAYLDKCFKWKIFSGEENQDMYEALWKYDSKLGQVDTAYYRFEKKYGERNPAPYGRIGQLLESIKLFINTIHFEYGQMLFHEIPYEALSQIDLLQKGKLISNPQFAEIMDEFEVERAAHQDISGNDTSFMVERIKLFKCEMEVHARVFLCAGYLEEKRKTELLNLYVS